MALNDYFYIPKKELDITVQWQLERSFMDICGVASEGLRVLMAWTCLLERKAEDSRLEQTTYYACALFSVLENLVAQRAFLTRSCRVQAVLVCSEVRRCCV